MADKQPRIRVDAQKAIDLLTAISGRVEPAIKDALDRGAADVQAHARANHPKIADSITGQRAARFRPHTINARQFSGQPRFLKRTGILVTSIKITRASRTTRGFESSVFSAISYANKIEFGGPRNRPYPFLRPALEANRKKIAVLIAKSVNSALRRRKP